ncbi:MAG: LysE family transporter [Bacteroidota bacterium]
MDILIYPLLGILLSILGALPLGTTNVAVINTTIKEDVKTAMKIVFTAALGEIMLVLLALNFNIQIENFIEMNLWVQILIAIALLAVGVILFLGRKECIKDENGECIIIKKRFNMSKQTLGFILGLINPTVLIYWILVISFFRRKMINLDINLELSLILLFLTGIFFGKVLTLYGYAKFSHQLKVRMTNITTKVNRIIGVLLSFVGVFQCIKLFYS